MLSIGDMMPDNVIIGIDKIKVPRCACCWVFENDAIKTPMPTTAVTKMNIDRINKRMLPLIGTPYTKCPQAVVMSPIVMAMMMLGVIFPINMPRGLIGETNS